LSRDPKPLIDAPWWQQNRLGSEGLRFALVGVLNTAFGFGTFAVLQTWPGTGWPYLLNLVVAHVLSVLEAFVAQRRLVFHVRGRWWKDLARFWLIYLAALVVNLILLPLLVEAAQLPVLTSQALVLAAVACGSFVAHRNFTFRMHRESSERPAKAMAETFPSGGGIGA
jgi:putative flippase GtrA